MDQIKESSWKTKLRHIKKYNYLILLPDDTIKTVWDILSMLMLLIVFLLTPYRIAFTEDESLLWIIIDSSIDLFFLIDIVVNFFSAYYNNQFILIDKWSKIACSYLKGWFIVDLISIIPFNIIIQGSRSYGRLAWLTKLNWLYKLIKLFRMVWMFKVVRDRSKLVVYLNKFFKIGVAVEWLSIFSIIFIILVHICTCLWVLLGRIIDTNETWIYN